MSRRFASSPDLSKAASASKRPGFKRQDSDSWERLLKGADTRMTMPTLALLVSMGVTAPAPRWAILRFDSSSTSSFPRLFSGFQAFLHFSLRCSARQSVQEARCSRCRYLLVVSMAQLHLDRMVDLPCRCHYDSSCSSLDRRQLASKDAQVYRIPHCHRKVRRLLLWTILLFALWLAIVIGNFQGADKAAIESASLTPANSTLTGSSSSSSHTTVVTQKNNDSSWPSTSDIMLSGYRLWFGVCLSAAILLAEKLFIQVSPTTSTVSPTRIAFRHPSSTSRCSPLFTRTPKTSTERILTWQPSMRLSASQPASTWPKRDCARLVKRCAT